MIQKILIVGQIVTMSFFIYFLYVAKKGGKK